MKTLSLLVFLSLLAPLAHGLSNYYPAKFQANMYGVRGEELKHEIFKVLDMKHIRKGGKGRDVLTNLCDQDRGLCYSQKVLGYRPARRILFGKLHLIKAKQGYLIQDVYCKKSFTRSIGVGPDQIPDHTKLNCEHTWPQSKFTTRFPKEMQKSDLHHLFPTDSKANGIRGNNEFGEVHNQNNSLCVTSQIGGDVRTGGGLYFEPPSDHKGNVARSLFYFSVRYRIPLGDKQEATLRKWHKDDPVDSAELARNEKIYLVQRNRNPFIDIPELVARIDNF